MRPTPARRAGPRTAENVRSRGLRVVAGAAGAPLVLLVMPVPLVFAVVGVPLIAVAPVSEDAPGAPAVNLL